MRWLQWWEEKPEYEPVGAGVLEQTINADRPAALQVVAVKHRAGLHVERRGFIPQTNWSIEVAWRQRADSCFLCESCEMTAES